MFTSPTRSRRTITILAGGLLFAALCAGCSAAGGGNTSGSSNPPAAAQGGSGGSVKAECKDQNNHGVSGSSKADEIKLSQIWDQDAADAPSSIQAKVVIVDKAYDDAIKGDASGLQSAQTLNALGAVATWVSKNCD